MKSFIKEKLRLVLEARAGARHTPTNSLSDKIYRKNITQGMVDRMKANIANARKLYDEKTMGNAHEGDGMYVMQITDSGHLKGIETPKGVNLQSGSPEPVKGGWALFLPMLAYRVGSHPEYDDDEREGTGTGRTPFEDAKIKMLTFMGDDIINFMKGDEGYIDGKGEEIGNEKMKDYEARKKDKKDLEMEFGRALNNFEWERYKESGQLPAKVDNPEISMGDDAKSVYNQIQDVVAAKLEARKSRDMTKVKQLSKIEKELRAKL